MSKKSSHSDREIALANLRGVRGIFPSGTLFLHPLAQVSADRMIGRINSLNVEFAPKLRSKRVRKLLVDIADRYWTDFEAAHSRTAKQLRDELVSFRKKTESFHSGWQALSPAARARVRDDPENRLGYRLTLLLRDLDIAFESLGLEPTSTGGRARDLHVHRAALALNALWTAMGGKEPTKSAEQIVDDRGQRTFVQPSHIFIHQALLGIDQALETSKIEAAIIAADVKSFSSEKTRSANG